MRQKFLEQGLITSEELYPKLTVVDFRIALAFLVRQEGVWRGEVGGEGSSPAWLWQGFEGIHSLQGLANLTVKQSTSVLSEDCILNFNI